MYASEQSGFSQDLEEEMKKLESCDALIFSFPLWWFGMPAILKGWCDRVLAMGRIYGGGKFFEHGLGGGRKRAMLITTTGGGPNAYDGWGLNPQMDSLLLPVQHGIFLFNGFLPLEPFVAWSAARISDQERVKCLDNLAIRMNNLFEEEPYQMPLLADFPNWGPDNKNRYHVVIKRISPVDDGHRALVPQEIARINELKEQGVIVDFQMSANDDAEWRAFLKIRATDESDAQKQLESLPLSAYLSFEITRIVPVRQNMLSTAGAKS